MSGCVVEGGERSMVNIREPHNLHLHRNTFYFNDTGLYALSLLINPEDEDAQYRIVNNIFYSDSARAWSNRTELNEQLEIKYNCIAGFESLVLNDRFHLTIDTTNITDNPLFVDLVNDNVHLTEESPCIDAGDPDSPRDPDGTRADIGAYFFPQWQSIPGTPPQNPKSFNLITAYPNPFNAQTTLSFSLPHPGSVSVDVYNLTGRKVQSWGDGQFSAGQHRIIWSPQQLPSGSYFVRLSAGDEVRTNKVTLLK